MKKIQGLDILNCCFLYSAYADDSSFSLWNIDSVIEVARTFKEFSSLSNLSLHMGAPKIKHSTTRMDYQNGGLRNVDLFFKIISFQCSWFRRLFDNFFHQWKVIPSFFINKTFSEHFKFHSNLDFRDDIVKCFPFFLQKYVSELEKNLSSKPMCPFLHTKSGFMVW